MIEKNHHNQKAVKTKRIHRRIDAFGWGAFFIWTGIAVLTDVGWGIGLIGVGLIIIGSLTAKEFFSEPDGCSGTTNVNC